MTLERDPVGASLARWSAEDPEALWVLLHDPVRQRVLREVLAELDPELPGASSVAEGEG